MRRSAPLFVLLLSGVLAACQPSNTQSSTGGPSPKASVVPHVSPSASPAPAPTGSLTVQKVGAVATPNGFTAFAVVANPSSNVATSVTVDVSYVAGSRVLSHRTGRIARISPGEQQATAVAFSLGASLPTQFKAVVSAVQWVASMPVNSTQVGATTFLQDARTPSVRVHLVNRGDSASKLAVTTVCWDASGNIRGGGAQTVTVGPDANGKDAVIQVAISTVPARCEAYSVTLS